MQHPSATEPRPMAIASIISSRESPADKYDLSRSSPDAMPSVNKSSPPYCQHGPASTSSSSSSTLSSPESVRQSAVLLRDDQDDSKRHNHHHHPYSHRMLLGSPRPTQPSPCLGYGSYSPLTTGASAGLNANGQPLSLQERRQRNKAASAKYRAKKNQQYGEMRSLIASLTKENELLMRQLDHMNRENSTLKATCDSLRGKKVAAEIIRQYLTKHHDAKATLSAGNDDEALYDKLRAMEADD